jgi:hypothetical protein
MQPDAAHEVCDKVLPMPFSRMPKNLLMDSVKASFVQGRIPPDTVSSKLTVSPSLDPSTMALSPLEVTKLVASFDPVCRSMQLVASHNATYQSDNSQYDQAP